MKAYFLDSSALLKRYISETGTTWIRSLVTPSTNNLILIAHISRVEIISGVMRRQREGLLVQRTAHAVRLIIDRHASREYRVIGLTETIIRRAEDLLEAQPLRAYDAIQLASALEVNQRFVVQGLDPIIFVSSDNRLLQEAVVTGLITDNPNLHP